LHSAELEMGSFLLTQSNPIQSGCSQLTSNPIHTYLVLNRTRKLYVTEALLSQ